MRVFKMTDVDTIERMLSEGKIVVVEWRSPDESRRKVERVKYVSRDGLVFTTGDCIYTGVDNLISIEEL